MLTAKVFQSGNSQAIRIPKEVRTSHEEFLIHKVGEVLILSPSSDPWFLLKNTIGKFPSDFMDERSEPSWESIPEREAI